MSGRKRITIDSYEYNRIKRDSANLADVKRAYSALQQMLDASNNTITQMRTDNKNLNNQIASLNTKVRAGETATAELRNQLAMQAVENQRQLTALADDYKRRADTMRSDLLSRIDALDNSVNDRIEANNRIINDTIERNTTLIREEMHGYVNSLNNRIAVMDSQLSALDNVVSNIKNSDADLLAMAREYYAAAQQIIAETENFHTFLDADGFIKAQQELNTAVSDINLTATHPTNASAARLTASSAYRIALETQHRIISQQIVWQNARETAYNCVSIADAQIEANNTLHVSENLDNSYNLSVDHWANGALAELRHRLAGIRHNLDNAEQNQLSIDDIVQLQAQVANIIEEVQNVSAFALSAFNASVERYDIVTAVGGDPRFRWLGERRDGYEGGDDRSSYRMTLTNPVTLDEIVITVSPQIGENGLISNQVNVDLLNPTVALTSVINETQELFMNDILEVLRAMGHKAPDRVRSNVEAVEGFEHSLSNMAPPDMNEWASAKPDIPSYQTGSLPTPHTSAGTAPTQNHKPAQLQRH